MESDETDQYFEIPHDFLDKITNKNLIQELKNRGHIKVRNSKSGINTRLKQTL